MAIYIQNLYIRSFRGIRDLEVERLNHINLIVGDNNCGKTSVLEAILLLRDPYNFSNVMRVARLRDQNNSLFTGRASAFENFCSLFLQPSKDPVIHLSAGLYPSAWGSVDVTECTIKGEWSRILLDSGDALQSMHSSFPRKGIRMSALPSEAEAFNGTLTAIVNGVQTNEKIVFHEYSEITGLQIQRRNYLNMLYLSPVDHKIGRASCRERV